MIQKEDIAPDLKAFMAELYEAMKQKGFSKFLKSKDNPEGETDGLDVKTFNSILRKIALSDDDELAESLRDWFKKEKWVRISTSGNIAGPCGTSKNKKNPDRCLPKAKAQSLSKAQRAATARKKKKAGAKGKTVVKNTKAATVTRENVDKVAGGIPYRVEGGKAIISEPLDDATKERIIKRCEDAGYHCAPNQAGGVTITLKKGTYEDHTPLDLHYKKGYKDLTGLFKKITSSTDIETIRKLSHVFVDNLKKASKIQRARYKDTIQTGSKSRIFDLITNLYMNDSRMTSGLTKEDLRNLVVGTLHEMQNEGTIEEKDDRCTRIAKRKYDTWPSAYASGAVVRCRRGEIWKGQNEDVLQESDCKHGRYFCNHDKKYKCRRGPKKSR